MSEHAFGEVNSGQVHCSRCTLDWPANLQGDAPDCLPESDEPAQVEFHALVTVRVDLLRRLIDAATMDTPERYAAVQEAKAVLGLIDCADGYVRQLTNGVSGE